MLLNTNFKYLKTKSYPMKIETLRHSAAHILAHAVKNLYPNIKLGIGPTTEEGFYYDFDKKEPFTPVELNRIEQQMRKLVKENHVFKKVKLSPKEIQNFLKGEPYKKQLYDDLKKAKAPITFFKNGNFLDLCAGPHIKSSGEVKAFKLLKIAGAYWKGDSKNKQLQRIYGTAFTSQKELDKYVTLVKEAKARDHTKLGKQMNLFSVHPEAPGMPFFHNRGALIYNKLIEFMTEEMRKLDYEINKTPMILNKSLWLKSGHWDHYKENMYFTKVDNQDFAVKPMNCPGNILIFKTKMYSYRDLPLKAGEFGIVHRHELSGVLNGLFRVRYFTQDDAHVFCTKEQIKDQIIELINLVDKIYKTFKFEYEIELSTRPQKAMGSEKIWKLAEGALQMALKAKKIKYVINPGEGAFYGPKIDFHIKDALGRKWQCGTIQLDFSMPEKFNLTYEGNDNKKHVPVMIHRAIYGSLERFIGILIEHYAGKFPLWLSPVQVKIITVSDKNKPFAKQITKLLKENNIRVELDDRAESIGKKVREAEIYDKPFYTITIGDKESKNKTLAIRDRKGKVKFKVKPNTFLKQLQKEIETKKC